jgi:hypothetical protein
MDRVLVAEIAGLSSGIRQEFGLFQGNLAPPKILASSATLNLTTFQFARRHFWALDQASEGEVADGGNCHGDTVGEQ